MEKQIDYSRTVDNDSDGSDWERSAFDAVFFFKISAALYTVYSGTLVCLIVFFTDQTKEKNKYLLLISITL